VAPELVGRVAGNRRRLGELAVPGEPGSAGAGQPCAPELVGRVAGNRRRLGELAAPGEPGSLL
jgi:hypothetical protein